MTREDDLLSLQYCERIARRFYWLLDRHEADQILSMVEDDCQWVRAGKPHVGPEAMRAIMLARPRDVVSRHLVCNEVGRIAGENEIEVQFDLLYLAAPQPDVAEEKRSISPKVLSGVDRYRRKAGDWRLVFKEVLPVF